MSAEAEPPTPLLAPVEGLPELVETEQQLRAAAQSIGAGDGPIAVDTERASGFRYSQKAYLIQLRRRGGGTHLIDPEPLESLGELAAAMAGAEWIIHSATQDLPCLQMAGLCPTRVFDTELAAKLLGKPRVGLSALLETELGFSLAKEHSASDWSTRPLPPEWLNYAALDVELLIELRATLLAQLVDTGRDHWAEQEFALLPSWRPAAPQSDPWRRTAGIHRVHKPRQLAVVRELWLARDALGRSRDKAVGRLLPDAGIIDIAKLEQADARSIARLASLRNRSHKALADHWAEVVKLANELPTSALPTAQPKTNGMPPPKAWADRAPDAAARWDVVRPALNSLAEEVGIAPEVLISPEAVKRLCWEPGGAFESTERLDAFLAGYSVRPWQRELCVPAAFTAMQTPTA